MRQKSNIFKITAIFEMFETIILGEKFKIDTPKICKILHVI